MTKKLLFPSIFAGLVIAANAGAAVIATEYFNGYGTSDLNLDGLNGSTGWDGPWNDGDSGDNQAKYQQGTGLSWSGSGYDNSGNLTGANDGAAVYSPDTGNSIPRREFTTSATTVWFSALISIDETNDRAVLWIDSTAGNDGNSGDFFGVLDGNIQMRYDGTNFTTAGTPTTGTHLLLGKAELNVSGNNDRLSFWFDPDVSGGEGTIGLATYTSATADTFGSSIDGIGLIIRDNDKLSTGGEIMDAIRVGTEFGDVVVPEPSTYALLAGFGALALVMIRRRLRIED